MGSTDFGRMVRCNDEGEIVSVGGGTAVEGAPFTEDAVSRMLASEPMASPGAAYLRWPGSSRWAASPFECLWLPVKVRKRRHPAAVPVNGRYPMSDLPPRIIECEVAEQR